MMAGGMEPVRRETRQIYFVLLGLVLVIAAISAITPLHPGR